MKMLISKLLSIYLGKKNDLAHQILFYEYGGLFYRDL